MGEASFLCSVGGGRETEAWGGEGVGGDNDKTKAYQAGGGS